MKKINFKSKFQKFDEHWSPKVIAEMNDYQFKLVKIEKDFIWHQHDDTDEVFIVIEGKIFIEFNPIKLTKKDWKKACPPNVCCPIALKVLPKTDPDSSILIGWTKYF